MPLRDLLVKRSWDTDTDTAEPDDGQLTIDFGETGYNL